MPLSNALNPTPGPTLRGVQAGCFYNSADWEQGAVKVFLTWAGQDQAFLVARVAPDADAASAARVAYSQIARLLQDHCLSIVHERLFGSLTVKNAVLGVRAAVFTAHGLPASGPLTYIQGQPPWGEGLAGIIIRAASCRYPQGKVWTVMDQGEPVGRGWQCQGATFILLQNIQGLVPGPREVNTRPLQTKRLIRRVAAILDGQGASYREVVRTWFYLDDILAWYPEFNHARSAIYRELGLMPINGGGSRWLPASTGIRGEVSTGAAGALDLLAVVGTPVRQLRSQAQPEALTYGSAFSRGALIRQSDHVLIQVSGTAAIDEQGRSLYPGDVGAQIDCTLGKIAALIGPEGAALSDIAAACVFVKRPGDALAYRERAAAWGLEHLPAVVMVADVCREELLFEMDAEVAFEPDRRIHE